MQDWLKITLFLCLFGTLREIRPSEPFVTEFLLGKWRNITETQLSREVYPVGTYSYLALLVFVFLVTDFLRFKPVIILSGVSGIAVYAVLLWTTSIEWLQVSQFLYGLYMATEVAYLTYIYAKVPSAKYPVVSSYTRVAALVGRFLSGASAQSLTYIGIMDYRDLNYITFTAQILATFWALWLPSVPYGIYFHRRSVVSELQLEAQSPDKNVTVDKRPLHRDALDACTLIARHARGAYGRPRVLAWSAMYAAALALFVQTQTYMQVLWAEIMRDTDVKLAYNGLVEAALTLLGAGAALAAACVRPAPLPALAAAAQALAVFVMTYYRDLLVSYAGYIVMGMLYHYTITLASAKIASELSDDSCFGLIFGINTLAGTALQALLTFILLQQLQMSMTAMYLTISGLYLLLAAGWLMGCMINYLRQKHTIF